MITGTEEYESFEKLFVLTTVLGSVKDHFSILFVHDVFLQYSGLEIGFATNHRFIGDNLPLGHLLQISVSISPSTSSHFTPQDSKAEDQE